MADGLFYRDTRQPFQVADYSSVAPSTTETTLWAVGASSPTILPANYWYVGKTVKLTAAFKWTSGTAGNITFGMSYGAASNPACKVNSTAKAAIASVGPFLVFAQGYAQCRSIGATGTLSMWGCAMFPVDLVLSTVQTQFTFPAAGTTVVSTIDTTSAANALMFHAIRSAGTDAVVCVGSVMEALK
jgi:hypothetical protein